jgi:hypothetical protein
MRRVVSLHYVNVARGQAARRNSTRGHRSRDNSLTTEEMPCHRQSPARGSEIDRSRAGSTTSAR